MVNKNRIRNVTGEVVFFTEEVEILKVLHDWLLREGMCSRYMYYLIMAI